MERKYKAFISYRHLPIDAEVAQKLHRTIERYIIPKDYRKDGNRKLGLVFRDKDELPITSNLSENLRIALDNSEYLISICSPKTKDSIWVLEEIEYFIKTHDREHVLVFLVDGTMEESVPYQLTKVYDENGEFIKHVEPLAANIVADSKKKRNKLFKVEVLRILATLIQCPFDALYRREIRRKVKQMTIISGIVLAVFLSFIGMLWNRNQEINKRLQETLVKESEMTAIMAEEAEKDGEYERAIEYALDGLPKNEDNSDRPYIPESEYALFQRLKPYTTECFAMTGSFVQDTDVLGTSLSPDGEYLATKDSNYIIRLYRCSSNELLYTYNEDGANVIKNMFITSDSKLVLCSSDMVISYDLLTGNKAYEINNLSNSTQVSDKDIIFGTNDQKMLLYSAKDGGLISESKSDSVGDNDSIKHIVMTNDESYLALSYAKTSGDQEYFVIGWNLKTNETQLIQKFTEDGYYNNLCFTEKNMLISMHMILSKYKVDMFCFELKKDVYKQSDRRSYEVKETSLYKNNGCMYLAALEFLKAKENVIYLVNRKTVSFIDLTTKDKIRNETLTGFYSHARLIEDGSVVVVADDGSIIQTSYDENVSKRSFNFDFPVRFTMVSGDDQNHIRIVVGSSHNVNQCIYVCWKSKNKDSICLLPASEKKSDSKTLVSRDGSMFGLYTIEKNDLIIQRYSMDTEEQQTIPLKEKLNEVYPECTYDNTGDAPYWSSANIILLDDCRRLLLCLMYRDKTENYQYVKTYWYYDVETDYFVELPDINEDSLRVNLTAYNKTAFSEDGKTMAYINKEKKLL